MWVLPSKPCIWWIYNNLQGLWAVLQLFVEVHAYCQRLQRDYYSVPNAIDCILQYYSEIRRVMLKARTAAILAGSIADQCPKKQMCLPPFQSRHKTNKTPNGHGSAKVDSQQQTTSRNIKCSFTHSRADTLPGIVPVLICSHDTHIQLKTICLNWFEKQCS